MNGTWTKVKYWWHPYAGIYKTTFIDNVMPLGWVEITKEMYEDYIA